MSGVSPLMPWMTHTGYLRRLSKELTRVLIVRLFPPILIQPLLTILLAHIGKSASLSQAALSAMNIDVDTSRFLEIVSPFTTRTLKDRKSNNKENTARPVSAAGVKKPDTRSSFVMVENSEVLKKVRINTADQSSSLSSAASSKGKHARSQSQPKLIAKIGRLSHCSESCGADLYFVVHDTPESSTTSSASRSLAKSPVFVPLEPIKGSTTPAQVVNKSATLPSRTLLSHVTASNTVKVRSTSGKENTGPKEPRVPKSKAHDENSIVRTPSQTKPKKPVGPRKPPPTLTPEKKRKAAGTENAASPKKSPTTITRGAARVLKDLSNTKANPNVLCAESRNSNSQTAFISPDHIASFFTSPDAAEVSMNLNIHGDSYASESVWLNRTTETTGKSQNESSFASLGKGSVKERWMDWERERERLRQMDKDKIRETDDEDASKLRRSIMTVVSEPEPETDAPLETDLDMTLEFAPVFRNSEDQSRRSVIVERNEDNEERVTDASAKTEEKEKEAENIVERRASQGSRILQTLLAAEPVTVFAPPAQAGRFRTSQLSRAVIDSFFRTRDRAATWLEKWSSYAKVDVWFRIKRF